MLERFPYGRAPFVLLVIAIVSSLLFASTRDSERAADLVIATFSVDHAAMYRAALPRFEKEHGVKVVVQHGDFRSFETRLQSAIVANTDVPDLAELPEATLGFFTRGPESDFGFMDLTERVKKDGLDHAVVEARYPSWTARGKIYALPHDVHPTMLAYRKDLIDQLGIDVGALDTWEKFVRVGREITKDLDGDGVPDRYMLDLPKNGQWGLLVMLRQRGIELFDAEGNVAFDKPETVDTIIWYLHQTRGEGRIAFEIGWGQTFYKAVSDGVVLFIITPDWKSGQYQQNLPNMRGKMALMPMPAWYEGGRRTSTYGMTGLAISATTKRPDLAWELAKFLYYDKADLGSRFLRTNIIPPLKSAWDLPEFHLPNPYYSNQAVGAEYARLAPDVPPVFPSPIYKTAMNKLDEVLTRSAYHYELHGDAGLAERVQVELERAAAYLGQWAQRHDVLARASKQ
jgi:arabinosaccharide transport system substrate-binding protein